MRRCPSCGADLARPPEGAVDAVYRLGGLALCLACGWLHWDADRPVALGDDEREHILTVPNFDLLNLFRLERVVVEVVTFETPRPSRRPARKGGELWTN